MRASGLRPSDSGERVTQLGHEERHVNGVVPLAAPLPAGPGRPVRIEPGTLMEKRIPANLVEPYLAGQRWVIAGFAYRVGTVRPAGERDYWILRWRALAMHSYLDLRPDPAGAGGSLEPSEVFVEPGPIPVGTEMFRVTPQGEEFIARHDGQAWLRPGSQPAADG